MNKDDVIRIAQEAFIARGFWPNEVMWECWKDAWLGGASAEREACAKVCEELEYDGYEMLPRAPRMARLIRARGQG